MDILILYATIEGQTAKIAQHIAQTLLEKHHQVTMLSVNQLPADFTIESFSAAIIGGPIHMGRYPKPLQTFIRQHRNWLNKHPSALFTVCMAINSQKQSSRQQAKLLNQQAVRRTE